MVQVLQVTPSRRQPGLESRVTLLITSPWPECEKSKNPAVFLLLTSFFIPLCCVFTLKHHPGSVRIAGHSVQTLVGLQLTEGYASRSLTLWLTPRQ